MLRLESLSVGHAGSPPLLSGFDIALSSGQFICLLGRNGAGKSTLMRTMGGLHPAVAGRVRLGGADLATLTPAERAQRIAVVLTERPPAFGLSVEDVVRLGRQPHTGWRDRLGTQDSDAIEQALSLAGGEAYRRRLLDDLSDGERQRVMIARALAQSPQLLLLDEITAFLDLPGRVDMMARLREITRARGIVTILSSHDLDLSLQFADSVWLLAGQGAWYVGAPDELARSGRIGECFDNSRIRFSVERYRFELVPNST